MVEVVIIPVLEREELLEQALAAIRKTRPEVPIRLFMDRGFVSDKLIALQMKYDAPGFTLPRHTKFGNAKCVLTALRWASENADYIHYIESDVIVSPEYWEWSHKLLDDPELFASCAWSNPTRIEQEMKLTYFSGVGCFMRRASAKFIADRVKHESKEWDVAVAKLCAKTAKFCAFPAKRLVTHAGHVGLNFNDKDSGDTGFVMMKLPPNRKVIQAGEQWKLVRVA